MQLWTRGALRQWKDHRFLVFILIMGYAVGISLTTFIYAAISDRAAAESDFAMGDPLRIVDVLILLRNEPALVDVDRWTDGVGVSWGWVFLPQRGAALSRALEGANVVGLFGPGPVDWRPPLRMGTFFSGQDITTGRAIAVIGDGLAGSPEGYQVVGVAYDEAGRDRGWRRDIFVPLGSLPYSLRSKPGNEVGMHIEVAPGQPLDQAKLAIERNIRKSLPGADVHALTGQDLSQGVERQFRTAYVRGFSFSALVLGFVAANVGAISIYWVIGRRRELSVRIAIGATVKAVAAMIVFEHVFLSLVGGISGVPILFGVLLLSNRLGVPAHLSAGVWFVAMIATLLSGLLSSLLPLYLAFRGPVVEALHYRD